MNNLVWAYIDFLMEFNPKEKPTMPKFNFFEYTESEYMNVVDEVMSDYQFVDDLDCSIRFLKGE